MLDPGSLSATFGQLSITSGTGTYFLGMTIRDKLPISAGYDDGSMFIYHVTDTSGQVEVSQGVLNVAASSLSRDTLILSSTGSFIDWPATGQRIVTPIINFPMLCPTPPLDGEVLIWSDDENAYCPANFCDLVNACLGI